MDICHLLIVFFHRAQGAIEKSSLKQHTALAARVVNQPRPSDLDGFHDP